MGDIRPRWNPDAALADAALGSSKSEKPTPTGGLEQASESVFLSATNRTGKMRNESENELSRLIEERQKLRQILKDIDNAIGVWTDFLGDTPQSGPQDSSPD